jgi:hypothetical protein
VRIALKGQGIAPELRLTPDDLPAKGLDLGDVAKVGGIGESVVRSVVRLETHTTTHVRYKLQRVQLLQICWSSQSPNRTR